MRGPCARKVSGRAANRRTSAPRVRPPDAYSGLRDGQPLADHSRNAASEEHQQFGAVARIEAEVRSLTERQQPAWQRRLAIDTNQRLRADQVARRAEQGMTALNGSHGYTVHAVDHAAQDVRIDELDSAAIGTEALATDDQRESDRVDAKDQRPFLSDDVKQGLDAIGIDRGEYRLVDRGYRARMPARKCD